MNEKLQYATMLEIPVSTSSVTFEPQKKRRRAKKKTDPDAVKQELVNKVNAEMDSVQEQPEQPLEQEIIGVEQANAIVTPEEEVTASVVKKEKVKKRFSIIGVQLVIIGLLVATIFLTNAFYTDSGINVFLREVFGTTPAVQVDEREYGEFTPVLALDDGTSYTFADGIITVSGEGSIYAPCNGTVSSIIKGEDGKFTIEITHSQNFKSVLGGLDYAYAGLNDSVYSNIPVGYVNASATMCFKQSDGEVITDYQIIDDSVVWAK